MVGGMTIQETKQNDDYLSLEEDCYDKILFEKLKTLRTEEAKRLHVPPYVVFGDKTLIQMARHLPKTPDAFLEIHGVARKKLEQFGEQFIQVIREYVDENM